MLRQPAQVFYALDDEGEPLHIREIEDIDEMEPAFVCFQHGIVRVTEDAQV
jgi:hypothetical protein